MYRLAAELGCAKVPCAGESVSSEQEFMEQERLGRLAALGVPTAQPEEPEPDVIERAARLPGMNRASLAVCAAMRGVSIEDFARAAIRKATKPPLPVIDRRYIERARRGYRLPR
ncbi:hypothetical protein [Burkholderia orbicola]|uniref:hypothetical protein n=1 Tax=Burkholderia orbicola TaxID=2978683 RepID=UPI00264A8229|nr:hypothetical protein [Burkholderia orbicola]MDN7581596.1 hypothetical protein [Burkholderia orbicola]